MQQVGTHNIYLDPFDQRQKGFYGASTPADKCAFGNIRAHALKDFVLAIQGKMIVEF